MLRDETAIPSSLNLGGVDGTFVKYWDESATVAVLDFKVEEPSPAQASLVAVPAKEKEKKRKARGMNSSDLVLSENLSCPLQMTLRRSRSPHRRYRYQINL